MARGSDHTGRPRGASFAAHGIEIPFATRAPPPPDGGRCPGCGSPRRPAAANHRDDPSPGAPGLGDRLFPTLGNGGYDARHYHPDLTYPTAAPQQYEGESVGTDEFIELAERVSRRDLSGFAQEWLFSTTVPPMPGHPDWELDPAGSDAPAPQARSQAMLLERRLHKH